MQVSEVQNPTLKQFHLSHSRSTFTDSVGESQH